MAPSTLAGTLGLALLASFGIRPCLGLGDGQAASPCLAEDLSECAEDIDEDVHEVQLVQARFSLTHTPAQTQVSAEAAGSTGDIAASMRYGSDACPCIGVERNGSVVLSVAAGKWTAKVPYPAAVGSQCKAWDRALHPSCRGANPPGWCSDSWCFVDACNCNLPVPPRVSAYATFQGRQVYYSYETCGTRDTFTPHGNPSACVNQASEGLCSAQQERCRWSSDKGCLGKELVEGCADLPSTKAEGHADCKCIGLSGMQGHVKALIQGKARYPYLAEVGSYCAAWDSLRHPDCTGLVDSYWCSQKWCYVDPCSCNLDQVPKKSTYFPEATHRGRPLFYSYRACGDMDSYTGSENAGACPNFMSEYQCGTAAGCTWAGHPKGCMSTAIVDTCGLEALAATPAGMQGSAPPRTPFLPLLAVALAAGLLPRAGAW